MTESATPLPPAGWYPDPEAPNQFRWWDGVQWQAPAAPPTVLPQPLGSGFGGLTTTLVWLIGLQGALYAGLVVLYVVGLGSRPKDIPYASYDLTSYDAVELVLLAPAGLLFFVTIVVWCCWQHSLARFAGRDRVRRSPGMHVGSWFIPVVMLWFPFQNMKDLWQVFVGRLVPGLLGGWWALWLITNVTSNVVTRASWTSELSAWEVNVLSLVDALFWVPMCALALMVVRRLSAAARAHEARA